MPFSVRHNVCATMKTFFKAKQDQENVGLVLSGPAPTPWFVSLKNELASLVTVQVGLKLRPDK